MGNGDNAEKSLQSNGSGGREKLFGLRFLSFAPKFFALGPSNFRLAPMFSVFAPVSYSQLLNKSSASFSIESAE